MRGHAASIVIVILGLLVVTNAVHALDLQRSPGLTHFRWPEVDHTTITIATVIGERRSAVAA